MIAWILTQSIRRRGLVLLLLVLLMVAGVRAFQTLPIDAVPDLTNVQVQVLTTAPALGTVDIERLVTAPVELAMSGLPRVQEIRSMTRYGASAVTVVFEDGVDPYFARQLVNERMPHAREAVPATYGVPEIGPMSTGLGEIYQFEVRGDPNRYSPMDLRSILDWDIAPRLRMVPGVVEVNAFGGQLKTYEVSINPAQLLATNVSLSDVFMALERNNRSAGGGAIHRGPEGLLVRGDALVESLDAIANIVVSERRGVPIYVRQLGDVSLAPMLRQGAATRDGRGEMVAGMTMMLQGENSRAVAKNVQHAVDALNTTLPESVRIEPFYNRTDLVNQTIATVARNLLEGGVLVIAVLLLMLRNMRAGLIAAAQIPLAMLVAFLGMRAAGVSGNLMSLGAIDFGLVVDGAIILLENAVHHLGQQGGALRTREERDEVLLQSAQEVRGATAFGELIIALVYVPILALQGTEAKMFGPMALTVLFALLGAFVLSITAVPALASYLLQVTPTQQNQPALMARLQRFYAPLLRKTLHHPMATLSIALCIGLLSVVCASRLGSEFVPRLDEGALIIETNRLPATSLEESIRQGSIVENILKKYKQVKTVITKTGRPEIANDLMGVEQSDVFVMLDGNQRWHSAEEREAWVNAIDRELMDALPGAVMSFSQPIEMRMNELISGVRSDFAVKIYGDDFATLGRLAAQTSRALSRVRGAADIKADRVQGLPVLKITVDRQAIARLGTNAGDILDAIETVGGHTVGTVFEGRRRFALRVRLDPTYRDNLDALLRLPVQTGQQTFVQLGDVAEVATVDEPVVINREATERRVIVQANVRGRDLGSFADAAQTAIRAHVKLPPGYHITYGGQFENLERARHRLLVVVPLVLMVITALLYVTFQAWLPALLILTNVPFAATGGTFALAVRGLPFSISAAVGFIALFGVAVLNGLVLVSQIRALHKNGMAYAQATYEGAVRRLRPVLTTALVASLGFVPMALATGAGAEVQRPLATVVIGGLLTSTLLTLLVLPSLYAWIAQAKERLGPRTMP